MATIGINNVSLNTVRTMLNCSPSLRSCCTSPNINKFSKNSPKAAAGAKFNATTVSQSTPHTQSVWSYTDAIPTVYRLGDFRGYTSDVMYPVITRFANKLVKGKNNEFMMAVITGGHNIEVTDVIKGVNLYPAIVYTDVQSGTYIWTTSVETDNDLTPYFTIGKQIRVTYVLSDTQHLLKDGNISATWYSVRYNADMEYTKTYILESVGGVSYSWDIMGSSPYSANGKTCLFGSGMDVGFWVDVKNTSSSTFTKTFDVYVYDKLNGDDYVVFVGTTTLTIGANSTARYSSSRFTGFTTTHSQLGTVYVRLISGSETIDKMMPMINE